MLGRRIPLMTSVRRLLLIADIGGEQARHIGDEAMLEANLDSLRRLFPEAAFTIVARDPEWVARRYGVAAVPSFGFPRDRAAAAEREAILAALLESPDNTQHATIEAVASADAVIVSGGGNLSSTWPDLLYERAALLQLAHRFGKPSVVLGQTIGPHLGEDERRLLVASLPHARFIGVRELPTAALAVGLGIPHHRIWYQFDDAMLIDEPATVSPDAATIAVTIDPQLRATGEALFSSVADQLRMLADATGARLVLIPHAFGGEARDIPSDLTEARLLAEKIGASRVIVAGGLDAGETRRVTAGAALVISSRYHPIVLGLVAGVPSLGIYGDDYCRIKLQGALAHARLERWALTYDDVAAGALLKTSLDLWAMRESIRNGLDALTGSWRAECRERWTAVRSALMGESAPIPPSTLFGRPADEVMPALASAFSAQQRWSEVVFASREARHRETRLHLQAELGPRRTLVRYVSALRTRLGWT
jgi:polysaccharide pyruvyl transferase WcaK-like protein